MSNGEIAAGLELLSLGMVTHLNFIEELCETRWEMTCMALPLWVVYGTVVELEVE